MHDLRLTFPSLTDAGSGSTLYGFSRSFDGAGYVTSAATTLASGTDNQAFCLDEQDRQTSASSATSTVPCIESNAVGSLTAAQYAQTFAYDALDRHTH